MAARRSGALPELARPTPPLPKAAREQVDVQPFEHGLVDLARVHHPGVHWWHGYRAAEERFGSYCYVCEQFIVTWHSNRVPNKAAVTEIDAHKWQHRDGAVPLTQSPNRKRHTQ